MLYNVIYSLIIIVIVVVINLIIRLLLDFFSKKINHTSQILPKFYKSIYRPLKYLISILGLWVMLTVFILHDHELVKQSKEISLIVIKISCVLCIMWACMRFIKEVKKHYIDKKQANSDDYNDLSLIETLYRVSQCIIIAITFLLILGVLHIPLVALAGMMTIVATFFTISQQELIKNLFGGMVIYLDRPFSIGDMIQSTDGNVAGIVEKISFRLTVIRHIDRRVLYVPNSFFLNAAVFNTSRMSNRRILQYFNVRYCDLEKLPEILEYIRVMISNHDDIDTERHNIVAMVNGNTNMGSTTESAFGAYGVNFFISVFTKNIKIKSFHKTQDEILMKVSSIIKSHNAEIAFPTLSLHSSIDEHIEEKLKIWP